MKLNKYCFAASCILSLSAIAGNVTCAQNKKTNAVMCFHNDKVRVNGQVRAAPFYNGGPKDITDTGHTARVHCGNGVLELTDRKGIAFVRNVPETVQGREFVQYLCEHQKTKKDPTLATN